MFKRKLSKISILLAAAAVVFVGAFATRPAYAAGTCGSNRFCLWIDAGFEGAQIDYYSPARFTCVNLPTSWWDKVSSVWNKNPYTITLYSLQNCSGLGAVDIYGGNYNRPELSTSFMNDEARSFWVN